MTRTRILSILCFSLAIPILITTTVGAQVNGWQPPRHIQRPVDFGVQTPAIPDLPGSSTSMSPDSWDTSRQNFTPQQRYYPQPQVASPQRVAAPLQQPAPQQHAYQRHLSSPLQARLPQQQATPQIPSDPRGYPSLVPSQSVQKSDARPSLERFASLPPILAKSKQFQPAPTPRVQASRSPIRGSRSSSAYLQDLPPLNSTTHEKSRTPAIPASNPEILKDSLGELPATLPDFKQQSPIYGLPAHGDRSAVEPADVLPESGIGVYQPDEENHISQSADPYPYIEPHAPQVADPDVEQSISQVYEPAYDQHAAAAPFETYQPVVPVQTVAAGQLPRYRHQFPINRNTDTTIDDGTSFDFETKKKDFPPFNEIINGGRFFGALETWLVEPNFQGNTAILTQGPGFGSASAFDFDSEFQPRFKFGFESEWGPGIEFTYFGVNSNSEIASFTSDGITSGQTSIEVAGFDGLSSVFANDPGETLAAQHTFDLDTFTISFFKDLKFPVSTINGNFGFQYASISQSLLANVTDVSGAVSETLTTNTDLRVLGPRVIIEYFRPVGHTPFDLVTAFGGSVLFGQRDQFVLNSETGAFNREGADEFLTLLDFSVSLQYSKTIGENRSVRGRIGFVNQTWIGGGNALNPQGDFAIRGFIFGIGYNR